MRRFRSTTEAIKAKKPRTQRDYKRVIDKYLLPKLGRKKLSDLEYEGDETFTVSLSNPSGNALLQPGAEAGTGTIYDNYYEYWW